MKRTDERASMTRALVYYGRLKGEQENARSPLELYSVIYGAYRKNKKLAKELWAAQECLLLLALLDETEVLKAINDIYIQPFAKSPLRTATKNEISDSVLRFALENHLDERTVYRRLSRARRLWYAIVKKEII